MKPSPTYLKCLLRIENALFKTSSYGKQSDYLFKTPIDLFEVNKPPSSPHYWAITGPKKTEFLKVIAGQYISYPPFGRVYPLLKDNFQYDKIQFLNFTDNSGLDKVHLSARYESFSYKGKLEITDDVNSVKNYITGANNYNSNKADRIESDAQYLETILNLFDLKSLETKWISSLSNGQMRRARLAKSLILKPDLLIIDDPFLGLDPKATENVSRALQKVSDFLQISVVLGLRIQDIVPEWICSLGYVNEQGLVMQGEKSTVSSWFENKRQQYSGTVHNMNIVQQDKRNGQTITNQYLKAKIPQGENPHIEFSNASVVYKNQPVLLNFDWVVQKGSKWRILGDNGTGKTTILSLITADHPQSWKSFLSVNGVLRKSGSGSSFFDINNRIGISSPELHALVPGNKTMMEIIMTGLSEDVGNSNFLFVATQDKLDNFGRNLLSQFSQTLDHFSNTPFNQLQITEQKLTLFLRAAIKNPEILILDEAFSCMDNPDIIKKCHELVNSWREMTVLAIGHIDWELPNCDYVLKLQGKGKPAVIEEL